MSKVKKTEVATSKKSQNVQHAAPAYMFSAFDELERWFEGAYPTLRQRRILGRRLVFPGRIAGGF
jgi:hypothetical protein